MGNKSVGFSEPVRITDIQQLSGFHSGEPLIDRWLSRHAKYAIKYHSATIFASFTQDNVCAGFYTLSAFSLQRAHLKNSLSRNRPDPVPAILIGRLGVDQQFQGQGLGKRLLADSIVKSVQAASVIGACGIVVHPIPGKESFYEQAGFVGCTQPGELYLSIKGL